MRLPIWAPFFCLFLRVFDRALTRLVALARSESYGSEFGMLLIFCFTCLLWVALFRVFSCCLLAFCSCPRSVACGATFCGPGCG
jgi:hypothetical protein